MKTSERFDKAIKALVKGYFNGTLAKGSCVCCAVGNIITEACGYKLIGLTFWQGVDSDWTNVFITTKAGQSIEEHNYFGLAKHQIDSTGYTWQELAKVEKAFEESTKIDVLNYGLFPSEKIDQDQLNGLYAVVDVLCDIEGITEQSESYKELFVKP